MLVDAGFDPDPVFDVIVRHDLNLTHVLLTHHHGDHAGYAGEVARRSGARVVAHREEVPLFSQRSPVDLPVTDGETLTCGDLEVEMVHIPGHTAGQLAFHVPQVGLFTGDTLFRGSIGGTQAPGHTTFDDLKHSLLQRLLTWPDDTAVLPGHRLPTTLGEERRQNPFLRVLLGEDPEGDATARWAGETVRLVVWARDYDDGFKAWIRRADGSQDVVPGSRVHR